MAKLKIHRRAIEKDYGLEDGELDGCSLNEIYAITHAEDGELDIYVTEGEK